jgi:hypothetical protein
MTAIKVKKTDTLVQETTLQKQLEVTQILLVFLKKFHEFGHTLIEAVFLVSL